MFTHTHTHTQLPIFFFFFFGVVWLMIIEIHFFLSPSEARIKESKQHETGLETCFHNVPDPQHTTVSLQPYVMSDLVSHIW